ncbi:hybrid sensor histidine kinase/response regulator [Nitrospirillum sp. BR 11828]|uniref:hybrid sensor histidine kinase/response regulator n=1 Tax=Nitrospirillum sp. BR 11828 TaxID=3104325 RepID=UPI002ACA3CE6|nr:ATP-binding protein [Nitrospirillum sp. BR 11828]MDZ5648632.1 PAS domain-containing protein [Nitrospirillum sp. BR 11828]
MAQEVIPAFLSGGGELASLIAAYDWAGTPLGPLELWPQSLRTTVGLILQSPVPIVTLWGPDGIMIYNDAYSVFAGGRHPQLLGSKVREGWHEVADFNDNVMKVGLAGGTLAYQDQELTLHRSGRPEQVWMNLDYSPILDEAGKPAGVIAIVVETTAKVRAERTLRVTADKLARLNADLEERVAERTAERDRVWRFSRDLLLVIGRDGIIRDASPAWKAILGQEPEELIGHSFVEMVWPDDARATVQAHEGLLIEGQLLCFENRLRHQDDGFRWISWNSFAEGDVVYGYGRDITEEKRQAEALRLAEAQLRQAQKMEAVGQLTGGLAHDFNNLLTAISGSLELLDQRIRQGRLNALDRYMTAARGAVDRAAALTHRLLAFSRQQTLDPRPTDVSRLVLEMEDLVRRTVGPAIALIVDTPPDLWTTLIDANQLESALLNLCINARDAMPRGGHITIEASNREIDGETASAHDMTPGQFVLLSVTDTGVGMPPEVIARAFDPFFTTKPIGQGTGLGLSMIYGFVRQSGGQIRILSEVGQGTTVSLYLPRHHGQEQATEMLAIAQAAPRAKRGETVLVVDDEPTVRLLVTEVLDELGYTTLEAMDGPEALRILQSDTPINLLVTDIGLPQGMNGRQLADAGRDLRPGLKVLFITGYAENAVIGNERLAPGLHVQTKPFSMEALASRIKSILSGS